MTYENRIHDYSAFRSADITDIINLLEKLLSTILHAHNFCSALQPFLWWKALLEKIKRSLLLIQPFVTRQHLKATTQSVWKCVVYLRKIARLCTVLVPFITINKRWLQTR